MSSTPIKRDSDYYEDDSGEIDLTKIVSSERSRSPRQTFYEENPMMRPRRQQQSGRQQFYTLIMDILATMQSSTKNDIRRAKKRELERGSHIAE